VSTPRFPSFAGYTESLCCAGAPRLPTSESELETGLGDERYDFDLQWSVGDEEPNDSTDARPTLFKAIEEQLGLKLVPAKGPVRSLAVDHIERPSPN
jgi:uncharacterized protein DUF3738